MTTSPDRITRSLVELLHRAFPHGLDLDQRTALLTIIAEEISIRRAAEVMAWFLDSDESWYNEVLAVLGGYRAVPDVVLHSVRAALTHAGYDTWLAEMP